MMGRSRWVAGCYCAVVVAVLWVSAAPAEAVKPPSVSKAQRAEAEEQFETGVAAHERGDVDAAAEAFGRAYAIDPSLPYLWALAVAEQNAGRLAAAKEHFLTFLAWADVPRDLRKRIIDLRAEAAERISAMDISLHEAAAREAAAREADATRIRQEQEEAALRTRKEPRPGDGLEDGRSSGPNSAPAEVALEERAERSAGATRRPGRALLGVGGALVLVGGGMTVWALVAKGRMDDLAEPRPDYSEADRESEFDDARKDKRTAETLMWVGYGLGAAVGITGAVLLAVAKRGESVTLAPWWSGDGAGLAGVVQW